ncbi:glycosyltransferase family 4 protein [uncultured Thermomonospora sp.]|uniref:glycosyltransferase family 4 protein n=1 Tax=uncultured Thermomonospora sp. TaxID=671175 RepID=UPI00259B6027|nr:glycosyltransferase family 4 protein [uncultured Thermomonospora sp.]
MAGRIHRIPRRLALLLLRLAFAVAARWHGERHGERVRVRILLQHAYGMGGTIRTALNLAGHLAHRYDVEVLSVIRKRREPFFAVPPGVRIVDVDDQTVRPGPLGRLLARLPSALTPPRDVTAPGVSLLTDLRLARALLRGRTDVLIGTKPVHNMLIAEVAPRSVAAIGQDHMNLTAYRPWLRAGIARSYPRLDLLAVLTHASVRGFTELLGERGPRVVRVPNAVPPLNGGMADPDRKVIITAGRLVPQKGYDLLIKAYAQVAAAHPDWRLRIFGSGRERRRLGRLIARHGLEEVVELCGPTGDLGAEMAKASVYVLSSRFEGMPMVVLEAMSKGLPVVAFDCPTGPAELIRHGHDGLLVPPRDVAALAAALDEIISDAALRRRMGENARRSAEAYRLPVIGARWEELIDRLVRSRPPAGAAVPVAARPAAGGRPPVRSGDRIR